jgi:hypothetical protein
MLHRLTGGVVDITAAQVKVLPQLSLQLVLLVSLLQQHKQLLMLH